MFSITTSRHIARTSFREISLSKLTQRSLKIPPLKRSPQQPERPLTSRSIKIGVPFSDKALIKRSIDSVDSFSLQRMISSDYFNTYWRVSQAMQRQSLIPLVHGQTQIFRISYEILKALGWKNGELLRFPSKEFFLKADIAMKTLPDVQEKINQNKIFYRFLNNFPFNINHSGRVDKDPRFCESLLSATIGLGFGYDESPLCFVFGQPAHKYDLETSGNYSVLSDEECINISNQMILAALREKKYSKIQIEQVIHSIGILYEESKKLEIGQLLVIGVPFEKISDWTYSSLPFGLETGLTIAEIFDNFSKHKPNHTNQVRLKLTKESLHPDNGIKLVNLMNTDEVNAINKDFPFDENNEEMQGIEKKYWTSGKELKQKWLVDRQKVEKFEQRTINLIKKLLYNQTS